MDFNWSVALEKIEEMVHGLIRLLPNLAISLVVLFLFYLLAKWVHGVVRRVSDHAGRQGNIGVLLGKLSQWGILVIGLLIAATILFPTFEPGSLIALLGLSTVAIGFAFKDIFQNFLAGILILVTRPFQVGDQIIVGDFEGTVREIQTRATFIRTYDGRRVVIPNSDLYNDKVTVNTAFGQRRSEYDTGIGYGDDIETARRVIMEAMRGCEGVLEDPAPEVLLVDLAESTVNLRARWWSKPQRLDTLQVQDRVLTAIKEKLTENGIDLPFPTQQILFHDQTEETDGDRSRQREGWPAGEGEVPEARGIATSIREVGKERAGEEDRQGSEDGRMRATG